MRCRKHHLSDHSSSVGVCASCLRDRLFSLIQSQSHPPPDPDPNPDTHDPNPKPKPPPLIFPRSVSPYITRRKSEPVQRFYTTPQHPISAPKKHKFSLLSRLFRSRTAKLDPDPDPDPTASTSTSSSYMYSNCRGLSPDHLFMEKTAELFDPEPSPARGFHRRSSPGRVRPSPSRSNVAGFAFCLSPLVRASPARNWAEAGFSGDLRVPATGIHNNSGKSKPHLSAAASFCKNRSKKLADIGRFNRNR